VTTSAPPEGPTLQVEPASGRCPRCGEPYDHSQEYCLECGLRLPGARGVSAVVEEARGAGPVEWRWPVLVTLVVALLATVAVVVVNEAADDEAAPVLVATTSQPPVPTVTEIVPTETVPTTPPAATQPPPAAPPPAAPPPPATSGGLTAWPPGVDGYTVVLSSLPAAGRAEALQKARAAAEAGLPEVGILDSSKYSSLHPGYYVVFSGVYGSMEEATQAVGDARQAGYDTAYARLIAS
jgi:hypothetical protein